MRIVKLLLIIALLFNASLVLATDYTQDGNVLGAWLMEVDENPIQDASSNNRDGTLKGAGEPDFATASPPAAYSTGYYTWDGNDDYINCGSMVGPSGGFSGVLWMKPNSTSANYGYINMFESSNAYLQWFQFSSTFYGRIHQGTSSPEIRIGRIGGTVASGWQHLGMTWDGTTNPTGIKLYQNGIQIDTTNESQGSFTGSNANSIPIGLGAQSIGGTPGAKLAGSLDEPAIFSDVLSSTEINDIMDNGLKPTTISATLDFSQLIFVD